MYTFCNVAASFLRFPVWKPVWFRNWRKDHDSLLGQEHSASATSIFAFFWRLRVSSTHVGYTNILPLGILYYIYITVYKSGPLVTPTLQLIKIIVSMWFPASKNCHLAFIVSGFCNTYLFPNAFSYHQTWLTEESHHSAFYWCLWFSHKYIPYSLSMGRNHLVGLLALYTTYTLVCPSSWVFPFLSLPYVKTILTFQWHLLWAIISPCF